jgi:hypothetical protein
METGQKVLYLFCLARSNLIAELAGAGVDGHSTVWVFRHFPDLCAIVSEVLEEDFCGEAAELRMQDLAWVGPRALRHEAVVEEVMRHSPVLPARFGTLFSSQERLAEFLDRHRAAISQFLERVTEQEEWSVRGLLDRRQAVHALTSANLAAQEAQLPALPPGTRYFRERRLRQASEKELSLWLKETNRQAVSDLMKSASDFRECQVVRCEGLESGIEVVLNWALLVPRGATAALRSRIDQLNADHAPKGLVFGLSGPWPPYRFVPPLSMGAAP